jgi:hypothetical protein
MVDRRGRAAWQGSTRKQRLPDNWEQLRANAAVLNPQRTCHWCLVPGGGDLDHKKAGDHICQQPGVHAADCQCNLDWIHGWNDVLAARAEGREQQNCHGKKSAREGAIASAAALRRQRRPEEPHPAFA